MMCYVCVHDFRKMFIEMQVMIMLDDFKILG